MEILFVPHDIDYFIMRLILKRPGQKPLQDVPDQLAHVRSWSKLVKDYLVYNENNCKVINFKRAFLSEY